MSDPDKQGIGYLPEGPEVFRVSYGYQFKQFDLLPKALRYIDKELKSHKKHMLTIQRVNLKEVKLENV